MVWGLLSTIYQSLESGQPRSSESGAANEGFDSCLYRYVEFLRGEVAFGLATSLVLIDRRIWLQRGVMPRHGSRMLKARYNLSS
jgi:hypothetical protein